MRVEKIFRILQVVTLQPAAAKYRLSTIRTSAVTSTWKDMGKFEDLLVARLIPAAKPSEKALPAN